MYEGMVYEFIMQRLTDRAKSISSLSVIEGSVLYNALAPAAWELAEMYIALDTVMKETFADTASRDYLVRRAAERGIFPKKSSKARFRARFNTDIAIGDRFSSNKFTYSTIGHLEQKDYILQCEQEGKSGNYYLGEVNPLTFIEEFEHGELVELLIPGEGEEDTERLRQRYFDSIKSQAFGGNVADYREKVNSLDGIGGVKVYPIWNGGGTVKLVIISSSYDKPSEALIEKVQNDIDPVGHSGDGIGIAPIGHVVTVFPIKETTIDIETNIVFINGWDFESCKEEIEKTVDSYFNTLAKSWEQMDELVIRISQIETKLLDIQGILDISDTRLNGETKNLLLEDDEIPVRGRVSDG